MPPTYFVYFKAFLVQYEENLTIKIKRKSNKSYPVHLFKYLGTLAVDLHTDTFAEGF